MAIYRKKPFWGRGSSPRQARAHPSELMHSYEGMCLPRRAGCLGTNPFHGPSEPNASLGKLASRKIKKDPFVPFLGIFLFS